MEKLAKLWITRPQAQAQEMAESLGVPAVIMPLIAISFPEEGFSFSQDYDAVIITSMHALKELKNHPHLLSLPLYLVGTKTALHINELTSVKPAYIAPDVNALLKRLSYEPVGKKWLYLSGDQIAKDLAKALPKHQIDRHIVYHAVAVTTLPQEHYDVIKQGQIGAVTVTSQKTAEYLKEIITRYQLEAEAEKWLFFAMSGAIAAKLKFCSAKQLKIADKPTIAALELLIKKHWENTTTS